MTIDVPMIARMIIIQDIFTEKKVQQEDTSYCNPKYDSNCEYCMNTTAWD